MIEQKLVALSLYSAAVTFYLICQCYTKKKERECDLPEFERLAATLSKESVWRKRKALFSESQSVSYSNTEPLMIVRGENQYLIDEKGMKWLDTRNNVGHVGWQDPTVVQAIQRQISRTNSNTRYLHPFHVLLGEKLLKTFKAGSKLRENGVVFFVNSGSEANELALRLARAKANSKETIVLERAYHGHTVSTIEISPYKFNGRGGSGRMPWIHVVPCPDTYRFSTKQPDRDVAEHYTAYVREICHALKLKGKKVGAFFMESGMSVAGVILPPKNYLKLVYDCIRAQGGVCVADEIQTGLGRFGDYFWGFEQQEVQPDIVTIGKPFGNGFPLSAVVCTNDVASAFHNGMEYFSTFGGNPVACSAGLAVLHVIERDNLQKLASSVGNYLRDQLAELKRSEKGTLIGDIRGCGLFQGIEFVRDRRTKEPATAETSEIVNRLLKKYQILTSIDGMFNNVLVLKPPMRFSKENVDYFIMSLGEVLSSISRLSFTYNEITPT